MLTMKYANSYQIEQLISPIQTSVSVLISDVVKVILANLKE